MNLWDWNCRKNENRLYPVIVKQLERCVDISKGQKPFQFLTRNKKLPTRLRFVHKIGHSHVSQKSTLPPLLRDMAPRILDKFENQICTLIMSHFSIYFGIWICFRRRSVPFINNFDKNLKNHMTGRRSREMV